MDNHDNEEIPMEAVVQYMATVVFQACLDKCNMLPCRTSPLSGEEYVQELLRSQHPRRFLEVCRMEYHVFLTLCDLLERHNLLKATPCTSVQQQVMVFLSVAGNRSTNRICQERFQHSGETISRYFHAVLQAICSLFPHFVHLPDPSTIPHEISANPKFYPYFKDCIGAIDGSHIKAFVPSSQQAQFRNRKGFLSQNILVACSFNLHFLYVLAGWEGSAADARVFQDAIRKGFNVPNGKYYLADAGYPACSQLLVPYRGVRYHLKEWALGSSKPQNAQELFNLRHASLRNAVERVLGILKKRFPILDTGATYDFKSQVQIVLATCMLNNFIKVVGTGEDDRLFERLYDEEVKKNQREGIQLGEISGGTEEEIGVRDSIAQQMWADYRRQIGRAHV